MSDIVDRLRRENDILLMGGLDISDPLLDAAAEIERLRAEINRLQNECYKRCGVCEFDYGRAAPPVARSGDS